MLVNILIVIGTFIFMEGVAWFTHKYIMHGILWTWHKSHHKKHDHFLELNDLFAVVFSIPSILLIYQSLILFPTFSTDVGYGSGRACFFYAFWRSSWRKYRAKTKIWKIAVIKRLSKASVN